MDVFFWGMFIFTIIVFFAMCVFLGCFLYLACGFTILWSILTPIIVVAVAAIVIYLFQFLMKHM